MRDVVENCGVELLGGVTVNEFDSLHELIAHEETCRLGVPGYVDGLGAGLVIGLPPVLQFGRPEVARKVGREVLLGKKRICLAISEPGAGSGCGGFANRRDERSIDWRLHRQRRQEVDYERTIFRLFHDCSQNARWNVFVVAHRSLRGCKAS